MPSRYIIEEKLYKAQVLLTHYRFSQYVNEPRWCSYYKQIEEIINCGAEQILLVGIGDGLVPHVINKIAPSIKIVTFDFDNELKPDICGDIRELSKIVDKYDAIICCQVLEHLPYSEFNGILFQLSMCLNKDGKLILSLPDSGISIKLICSLWEHEIKFLCKIPRVWNTKFKVDSEHYWEINSARIYTASKIRKAINSRFEIEREYLVEKNPYHRFYVLSLFS